LRRGNYEAGSRMNTDAAAALDHYRSRRQTLAIVFVSLAVLVVHR